MGPERKFWAQLKELRWVRSDKLEGRAPTKLLYCKSGEEWGGRGQPRGLFLERKKIKNMKKIVQRQSRGVRGVGWL